MYAPPATLALVAIRSADIERAVTFYRTLGLLMTNESSDGDVSHYSSHVDGREFALYGASPGAPPTSETRLGFVVDSVDEIVPRVLRLGAKLIEPPRRGGANQRAVVQDFDGHVVVLTTPAM